MASPGPSGKLSEMLRAGSQPTSAQQYHDEMQSQQQRMAVMAAAVSAGDFLNYSFHRKPNIPIQIKKKTFTFAFVKNMFLMLL